MGNLLTWIQDLTLHVFARREERYRESRSAPDHPERIPPNNLTVINKTEGQSQSPPNSVVPTARVKTSSKNCSDFYLACRTNNIEETTRLLSTMETEEIDRIEPNGSTALHAACFHGHREIVELLLKAGADRAIQNKYKYTPFDEAKNNDISELFNRIPNCNRFTTNTGALEWELFDNEAHDNARLNRQMIETLYRAVPINRLFENIEKNYICKELKYFTGIEHIKRFFQKAREEQDPIWIIKAYTAETDFYKIFNAEMAGGTGKCEIERKYIIALFLFHPKLDQFSYTGPSYRVIEMNEDSINK
jgi:hypothetical protein